MALNNKEFINDVKISKKHVVDDNGASCFVYSQEECVHFQVYDIRIENGHIIIESD